LSGYLPLRFSWILAFERPSLGARRLEDVPMTIRAISFDARALARRRGGITIPLPFDPNAEWGTKDRHYVDGTIGGYRMRGVLTADEGRWTLSLGPSWCRDPRVGPGTTLAVVLQPEGPQLDSVAPDVAGALLADPEARRFFESLATHYRNGFIDWIETAKRPETRAKRIAQTVTALQAGRREP
jgi:hypothetical protein